MTRITLALVALLFMGSAVAAPLYTQPHTPDHSCGDDADDLMNGCLQPVSEPTLYYEIVDVMRDGKLIGHVQGKLPLKDKAACEKALAWALPQATPDPGVTLKGHCETQPIAGPEFDEQGPPAHEPPKHRRLANEQQDT